MTNQITSVLPAPLDHVRTEQEAREYYTRSRSERFSDNYPGLQESITLMFETLRDDSGVYLVDYRANNEATDLFMEFLIALPYEARGHYNCNACRKFVNRFGGLVTIKDNKVRSLLWDPERAPEFFRESVTALKEIVEASPIMTIFETSISNLGIAANYYKNDVSTGMIWEHMHVEYPEKMLYVQPPAGMDEFQKMADHIERRKMLERIVKSFQPIAIKTAIDIVKADNEMQPHKFLFPLEWVLKLVEEYNATKHTVHKDLILWNGVYNLGAYPEMANLRSSAVGSLIEDIQDGYTGKELRNRFLFKVDPVNYKRPTSEAAEGNIDRANEIVNAMGIKDSFKRRFANLEEVLPFAIWTPAAIVDEVLEDPKAGLFDGLKKKQVAEPKLLPMPERKISWNKFESTVMSDAKEIIFVVPNRGNYCAILTAEVPDAPPIIKWDRTDVRNPFTNYVYHNGSYPSQWNIPSTKVKVNAITRTPGKFVSAENHYDDGIIFILDGAKDVSGGEVGLGLFPDLLIKELHEVRKTIENFSNQGILGNVEGASACGYMIHDTHAECTLIVNTETTTTPYRIVMFE